MVLCSDSPPTPWKSHVMDRIAGGLGVGGKSIDITTEQEQGDTTTEGKHNKEVALSLAIVCSYQVPDFQTVKLYFYA